MISPKVSIITASLNSERTIADTIESVLYQTYENIEFLIIDGGSSDKTISIIKKYEASFYGKLIWISEKDKGIYDAWNKGLYLSTGDWISFLGSDDILLKDSLSEYIKAINNFKNINFISSRICRVNKNLEPIRIIGQSWNNKMYSYCCIAHVSSLHHKSLFYQKGQFNTEYQIAGDYDFLLRCSNIISPLYLPIIAAKVRMGGISDRNIFRVAKEILKIKLANKTRTIFFCYIDYYLTLIKYYLRGKLTFN